MNKLNFLLQVIKNMGWRYVLFRVKYEFLMRSGILKLWFPTSFQEKIYISLEKWRRTAPPFFFESKEKISFKKNPSEQLKQQAENILNGRFLFFNAQYFDLGNDYNWIKNPENNYTYPLKHWTEIPDFSTQTGDIKFVWEKSRFSYLHTIIRYDYHFSKDCSGFVFREIISWINANPLNRGPNYRCSQEISLRVLNWIFALYYYRNSENLTEDVFQKITNAIYWQIDHDYHNIDFSKIAVRNNHAITETLALYLVGTLMPFFPNAKKWKTKGKKWFEEEISYQIYEDGTFLQFSMNYHRVVVQLFTWALNLSKANGEQFDNNVEERAKKSLTFLMACLEETSGYLPNYGANDGALFFPLNNQNYRDYRPQLDALYYYFNQKNLASNENIQEDALWYGAKDKTENKNLEDVVLQSFDKGGYYIIKDTYTITFVRCGNHKDRPSQADNLHVDIWVNDKNIMRDAGSYKYNTDEDLKKFFYGTASHNTVMLGDFDQMKKGPRFIWLNWTKTENTKLSENEDFYIFEGSIKAFGYISDRIRHKRIIKKHKTLLYWEIIDKVEHTTDLPINQIWNPSEYFFTNFVIEASNEINEEIKATFKDGWFSGLYGTKEPTKQIIFSTNQQTIKTIIKAK